MGRQSARMWFDGHDHKDIYFDGHYHKQMYLCDENGELSLVWEKLEDVVGFQFSALVTTSTLYLTIAGDFVVDWGDGTIQRYSKESLSRIYHEYSLQVGSYTVTISGNVTDLSFSANREITKIINALPATLSNKEDFTEFFWQCEKLREIPSDLFSNCVGAKSFKKCFSESVIEEVPEGLFDACVNAEDFSSCFSECYNFNAVPSTLFANCNKALYFNSCFYNTEITRVPKGLFDNNPLVTNMAYCFYSSRIGIIEDNVFDSLQFVTNYNSCFAYCSQLTTVPYELFDKSYSAVNFEKTFFACQNITTKVPPLWERDNVEEYTECYYAVNNAENYSEIPDDWK